MLADRIRICSNRKRLNFNNLTKLNNPDIVPTGYARGLSFSPNGKYMAVAAYSGQYLYVYKQDGDFFTKITTIDTFNVTVYSIKFSPDGNYLAVGHGGDPYLTIYKRSDDTFLKLSSPPQPTNLVFGIDFSPDSNYLAIGHRDESNPPVSGETFLTIYKRSGDAFSKLSRPSQPISWGDNVEFSLDGNYLAVSFGRIVYVFKRSGDTFTVVWSLESNATSLSFSPDGNYLAVGSWASPYPAQVAYVYKRTGDVFAQIASLGSFPGQVNFIKFSPDGRYLVTGYDNSPYVTSYKKNGDTFEKLGSPTQSPAANVRCGDIAHSYDYMALGLYSSPYIAIYK